YFDVLRLHPYLGRFFHASDERGPNSAPYVVLNYAFWHTHFHDDPGVAGRMVQLNKHPFTIIGVAPLGFHGTLLFGSPDFFVPLVNQEQIAGSNFLNARGNKDLGNVWTSQTRSYSDAGRCRPEHHWRLSAEDLSQRRGQDDLRTGAPNSLRRLRRRSDPCFSYGSDVARTTGSSRGMRQSWQPVRRSRGGPFPGSCSAPRTGSGPRACPSPTIHGSHGHFANGRRVGFVGQRRVVAVPERVAPTAQISGLRGRQPGCSCLWNGFAFELGQRIALWRGSGQADSPHEPLRRHQIRV